MLLKKGMYNIIFAVLNQIIIISLGLIIPRLFIINLGSEANGLMSSLNQVFTCMALLEAGVGAASVQALYRPIAQDDRKNINQIMSATSKYYKKTGIIYIIIIFILAVMYPYFVETKYSHLDIFLLVIFSGIGGALNYLFQGKYKIYLMAEGKNYIITNINTTLYIITSLLKIILIYLGYDIVLLQGSFLIVNLLQIALFSIYMKKSYAWLKFNDRPNWEAISQRKSVLIHQISGTIFANTDIFLVTIFCGLKLASVYTLYNLIISNISNLINIINSSVQFILGQTYQLDKSKYILINEVYEVYYMAITFSIYTIAYILILPFMKLYTAGVTDIEYIDNLLPILFIFIQILSCGRVAANNAINVAGHFRKTQKKSILETIINITASLIFINIWGVYGVLLGTIIALLYRVNDIILYSNKHILKKSPKSTYIRWGIYFFTMMTIIYIVDLVKPIIINSYLDFIIIGVFLAIIIIPIYLVVASISNRQSYHYIKSRLNTKCTGINIKKVSG